MSLENSLALDKMLVVKFKQVFLILKMSFKLPLKLIYLVKKQRKKLFWLNRCVLEKLLAMTHMKKPTKKGTQHQRILHIWLITKTFFFNI